MKQLFTLQTLEIPRCIKPKNYTGEGAILLIMSDGSKDAICAACWGVFPLKEGGYKANLICAKGKLGGKQGYSIPRMELAGLLIGLRLRQLILKASKINYSRVIHAIDSSTVFHQLQRESRRFAVFEQIRLAEVHRYGHLDTYFHTA